MSQYILQQNPGMALIVKNTFLDVEEPMMVELPRRANSLPPAWKPGLFRSNGSLKAERMTARGDETPGSTASYFNSSDSFDEESEVSWTSGASLTPAHFIDLTNAGRSSHATWSSSSFFPSSAEQPHQVRSPLPKAKTRHDSNQGDNTTGRYAGLREFGVTLDMTQGHKLGLNVLPRDGVLIVKSIKPGGAAAQWNKKRGSKKQIKAQDIISEVNGISGDSKQLSQLLQQTVILKLKVLDACNKSNMGKHTSASTRESKVTDGARYNDSASSKLRAPEARDLDRGQFASSSDAEKAQMCKSCGCQESLPVISCLEKSLMSDDLAGQVSKEISRDGLSVQFEVETIRELLRPEREKVLSGAKKTLLDISSGPQNVYLLGYGINPFKANRDGGFNARVSYLAPEKLKSACWDAYQKGFCPRQATCCWCHPAKTDIVEISVSLKSCSAKA